MPVPSRNSARVISPPRSEHDRLRRPLNAGERRVLDYFDNALPPEWEIYIEPHLNGLRPDFVLLHPRVGIGVFEVKDWDLDAVEYWVEHRDGVPLICVKDSSGRRGVKRGRDDPFVQAALYRDEIPRLYCPSLDGRSGIAAITAGVIFPSAADDRVQTLFADTHAFQQPDAAGPYWRLIGSGALDTGRIEAVLPSAAYARSNLMTPDVADELRHWLVEPEVASEQRHPPALTAEQRRHVEEREGTLFRRLRGPAGSGKSAVLAARAQRLEAEGRDALVLTYNLTLPNYLRDLSSAFRAESGPPRTNGTTWLSFHDWCRRQVLARGCGGRWRALWREYFDLAEEGEDAARDLLLDEMLTERVPELVLQVLEEHPVPEPERYDAILVDEGQDWLPHWFELVRSSLRIGGEVFFVADATQDLYNRAPKWTDGVMSGVGFRGDWRRLTGNHRMPRAATRLARDFALRHLGADEDLVPRSDQLELEVERCSLRWVQSSEGALAQTCLDEIDLLMTRSRQAGEPVSWADLFLVFDSAARGRELLGLLGEREIRVRHTLDVDSRAARTQKLTFFKGDGRAKATTVHSFKGWEARAMLLVVNSKGLDARRLLYSGITRLKRSERGSFLTVVCTDSALMPTGRMWPEYAEART